MAYRSYLKYYGAGNQASVMTDFSTYLQAMGYTLEDNISATRNVLSTVGEDGAHTKFWIDLQTSGNYVYIIPYTFFNTSTNTGYGGNYAASNAYYYRIDCSAAGYLKLYGSKDLCYFEYSASSTTAQTTTNSCFFGVIPYDRIVPKPYATTANAETAGAGITIEVDDTDGFQRNDYYQIVDPTSGMRERIQITAIVDGVSVTATLANAYGAGSIIAYLPHSGFSTVTGEAKNRLYPVCAIGVSGTGACTEANGTFALSGINIGGSQGAGGTAIPRNNLYQMCPFVFYANSGSEIAGSNGRGMMGYNTQDFFYNYALAPADILGCVDAGSLFVNGTATAGGAATMTDGGAAWGVDALVGKILVITGGTGAGQTGWITTNSGTVITVGRHWVTQPVSGSTYMIVDDAYRSLATNPAYMLCRETFGQP